MSDPVSPEDRTPGKPAADEPADVAEAAVPVDSLDVSRTDEAVSDETAATPQATADEEVAAETAMDTPAEAEEPADAAASDGDADTVDPEESPDDVVEPLSAVPVAEPSPEDRHALNLRLVEALLFASGATLNVDALAERLPPDTDVETLLAELAEIYAPRGVNLVKVAGGYAFRTAPDLAQRLKIELPVNRKLSRAAVETLAIIAYHQPVTRAEIEQIRGVGLSKGTLDFLFEQTWIHPMGRRRAPGKPVTWGTTAFFLEHFGLGGVEDLPGHDELKAAGLLDVRADVSIYRPDEPDLPLEDTEDEAAEPLDVGAAADKEKTTAG